MSSDHCTAELCVEEKCILLLRISWHIEKLRAKKNFTFLDIYWHLNVNFFLLKSKLCNKIFIWSVIMCLNCSFNISHKKRKVCKWPSQSEKSHADVEMVIRKLIKKRKPGFLIAPFSLIWTEKRQKVAKDPSILLHYF